MLTAKDIHIQINNTAILEGVNLEIPRGKITVILGPNGAGKSTLLKTLSGHLAPTTGTVTIDGANLKNLHIKKMALKRCVMRQSSVMSFNYSVKDIVETGRFPYEATIPKQENESIIHATLENMDLVDKQHQPYNTLSGGEKARVGLAKTIVQSINTSAEKPYIFLDEPNAAMDIYYSLHLMQEAKNLAERGHGVLLILHDINLAYSYADHIHILYNKTVYASGTKEDPVSADMLQKIYKVPVRFAECKTNNRTVVIFG